MISFSYEMKQIRYLISLWISITILILIKYNQNNYNANVINSIVKYYFILQILERTKDLQPCLGGKSEDVWLSGVR